MRQKMLCVYKKPDKKISCGFKEDGFNVLGLIIIIVMLGISLTNFSKVAERTRVIEAKNMLSSIRNAQFSYFSQRQRYANDLTKLDIEVGSKDAGVGQYFSYYADTGPLFIAFAVRTNTSNEEGYDYKIFIDEKGILNITAGYEHLL